MMLRHDDHQWTNKNQRKNTTMHFENEMYACCTKGIAQSHKAPRHIKRTEHTSRAGGQIFSHPSTVQTAWACMQYKIASTNSKLLIFFLSLPGGVLPCLRQMMFAVCLKWCVLLVVVCVPHKIVMCVYVCMHMYIYIYTYIHTHTHGTDWRIDIRNKDVTR